MTDDAHRLECGLRRELHQGGLRRARLPAFDAPRRILLAAHVGQRPLSFHQAFHFDLQPQASAIPARPPESWRNSRRRTRTASAIHLLDGGVVDVALADGNTGGFAIAVGRPPQPPPSMLWVTKACPVRGSFRRTQRAPAHPCGRREAFRGARLQRQEDGVDHARQGSAPRRHGRWMPRHHVVAFLDLDLQRAKGAFVDRLRRHRKSLVRDQRRRQRARVNGSPPLRGTLGQVDGHAAALMMTRP